MHDDEREEEEKEKARSAAGKVKDVGFAYLQHGEDEDEECLDQEEQLAAMFVALAKCTSVALACRQKEHYSRALEQLQRGLHTCELVGQRAHPRVALAIAKTRLNIASILSQSGRHEEAMLDIQHSEDVLADLLAWCDSCDPSDIGVCAIFEEAVALRCMALMASAVEEEHFGPLLLTPPQTPTQSRVDSGMQERPDICRLLYEEASSLAATVLPPTHPVIPYTRMKRDEYIKKRSAEEEAVDKTTGDGESHVKIPRSSQASRGVLPIQVQADPHRWNLAPAARRGEMEGSEVSGGYMLKWCPDKDSPASPTKITGARKPSKGDSDRKHAGALERKGITKEQNRAAPDELLPRLDGEDHPYRERARHRRNPFVEWAEGDTSKTEERKRRMEDAYQDMFKKGLQHHRTEYVLDFKRLSNDDLYENRTVYTTSSHVLRTKALSKQNLSRSAPVLKTEQSARTRKKKREDDNELQSVEAASAQTLREQMKQSHRSLQENTPKKMWNEYLEGKWENQHDLGRKPVSLGAVVSHQALNMGSQKKQEMTQRLASKAKKAHSPTHR